MYIVCCRAHVHYQEPRYKLFQNFASWFGKFLTAWNWPSGSIYTTEISGGFCLFWEPVHQQTKFKYKVYLLFSQLSLLVITLITRAIFSFLSVNSCLFHCEGVVRNFHMQVPKGSSITLISSTQSCITSFALRAPALIPPFLVPILTQAPITHLPNLYPYKVPHSPLWDLQLTSSQFRKSFLVSSRTNCSLMSSTSLNVPPLPSRPNLNLNGPREQCWSWLFFL